MTPTAVGILGLVALVVLLFSGMPVGFTMALVGFVGFLFLLSGEAALSMVVIEAYSTFYSYSLTVIPMFILMGTFAYNFGASRRLYSAAYKWIGQLRGGLAIATIMGCAGFAAICGSTTATAASMGKVALPEMKKYHYDMSLATGCVASAGGLGILIPPSIGFIVYGVITAQSIGKLLISGILPGILLTCMFILTVYILCRRNPALGPPGPKTSFREKLLVTGSVVEMLALFLLVIVGLFVGLFTPTEAGGIGAAGALVIGMVRKQFTWERFVGALGDALRITCMAYIILTGCMIMGRFLTHSGIPLTLAEWVGGLPLPPAVVMGTIIFGYFLGGMFMDTLGLMVLTVPILFPVVTVTLGFHPIWFGVMMILVGEMGVITPPVGSNVYVISGVAPDVPLETIFKGIFPFLGAIIVVVILLIFFPQIALFLPGLM